MKIAVILPPGCHFSLSQPNSMETVVRTLAQGDPDAELRIFCCDSDNDHGDLPVHALPTCKKRMAALEEALEDFQPDVIEFHQQLKQAVRVARRFPRATRFLYRHNALKSPRNLLDKWRYEQRFKQMDGLIFVSEAGRRDFLSDFPSQEQKTFAVPNPINVDLWRAPVENREQVIAFAGRAMAEKGVDLICAALPAVLDRHPDWRAVLMLNDWETRGDWAEPHIAPLARYGDRVRVMKSAPLAKVRAVMQKAAIALTPSTWAEPLGLTALEAHAAGAALISSGRGGLKEASGPHALYVGDLSPEGLQTAIEALIADPGQRLAMARAAQDYVTRVHTPTNRAQQLRQLREQAVQKKERQRSA